MGASHDRDVATLWPVEANRLMIGETSRINAYYSQNLHSYAASSGALLWQWRKFVIRWVFFFVISGTRNHNKIKAEAGRWISQRCCRIALQQP